MDAYIYGYPLVTSDITGKAFTNIDRPEPSDLPSAVKPVR